MTAAIAIRFASASATIITRCCPSGIVSEPKEAAHETQDALASVVKSGLPGRRKIHRPTMLAKYDDQR